MKWAEISATYWGGAPGGPASVDRGMLSLTDSGVIDYDWYDAAGAVVNRRTAVMLLPEEVRAVSTNRANRFGGPTRRPADLKVLCERDGEPFIAIFAAAPPDIRAFHRAIQRQRASVGEPELPTIEVLLADEN